MLSCLEKDMFEILRLSGLDDDLLAWIWEHITAVSFITIGPRSNSDGTFSKEQGIVALYLAQMHAGLELGEFIRILSTSQSSSTPSGYPRPKVLLRFH